MLTVRQSATKIHTTMTNLNRQPRATESDVTQLRALVKAKIETKYGAFRLFNVVHFAHSPQIYHHK